MFLHILYYIKILNLLFLLRVAITTFKRKQAFIWKTMVSKTKKLTGKIFYSLFVKSLTL